MLFNEFSALFDQSIRILWDFGDKIRVFEVAFLGNFKDYVPKVVSVNLQQSAQNERSLENACQFNTYSFL